MRRPLQELLHFLRELKRRNVYKVGVTYAVVAFVVWQAAGFLFPAFGFPAWTVDFVVILTVLGFPVALVLAWAFEMTPDGVRQTRSDPGKPAGEGEVAGSAPDRRTLVLLVAALVLLPLGWWWLYGSGDRGGGFDRLAVLPLTNLMNDSEQEYFIQGMHHELISELQRAGVPVIARTSVLPYGDGEVPVREIAAELGVGAVVEAAVLRIEDSVEIDASIVDPDTEESVWTGSVTGDLRDVEALHRDLSRAIAREIQAALDPEEEARLEAEPSRVVPQAYDAYLRGVYRAQSFTPRDFDAALEHFRRALAVDPTYAPAHVGVARVWQFRAQASQVTGVSPREARRHIRPALERALELDPELPEAHMAVGWLRTWNEWELEEGLEAFELAVRFNPGHAEARVFYAHLLTILGQWDEAERHAGRAVELDPLNPFITSLRGVVLTLTRRYDEAIELGETLYRDHPDAAGFARTSLIHAYYLTGRHEEALDVMGDRYRARGQPELTAVLERGYREGGFPEAVRRLADTLVARRPAEGGPAAGPYGLYAMAGEEEDALTWLERAVDARSQNVPYMGVAPVLEPLHDRRRFRELADRVGVPLVTGPAGR